MSNLPNKSRYPQYREIIEEYEKKCREIRCEAVEKIRGIMSNCNHKFSTAKPNQGRDSPHARFFIYREREKCGLIEETHEINSTSNQTGNL